LGTAGDRALITKSGKREAGSGKKKSERRNDTVIPRSQIPSRNRQVALTTRGIEKLPSFTAAFIALTTALIADSRPRL
jgi:hypothetical protein